MLSSAMVEEIRRLLVEGKLSQREISQQLRVSRGTVTSVALNRRHERPEPEDETQLHAGPPTRCRTCGGLVYLPCVLCRAREAKFGPRGERSLLSADVRPSIFGGRNERRSCGRTSSERGSAPRDVASPPSERERRLLGRQSGRERGGALDFPRFLGQDDDRVRVGR